MKKVLNYDTHFNSIKVRLKLNYPKELAIRQTNFNSIKVRLKHHNRSLTRYMNLFQFHKGTIKTMMFPHRNIKYLDFNSIKVRLKLYEG